ncbi:hypothetical protein chiPu_0022747, partial [Chiloscyllium punctatum]|nr:hypothetical protein [Chiloscyllium punctatum]
MPVHRGRSQPYLSRPHSGWREVRVPLQRFDFRIQANPPKLHSRPRSRSQEEVIRAGYPCASSQLIPPSSPVAARIFSLPMGPIPATSFWLRVSRAVSYLEKGKRMDREEDSAFRLLRQCHCTWWHKDGGSFQRPNRE